MGRGGSENDNQTGGGGSRQFRSLMFRFQGNTVFTVTSFVLKGPNTSSSCRD